MSRNEWFAFAVFLLAVAVVLALLVILPGDTYHADCEFYLLVDGRIVDGATGAPIAKATVLAIPQCAVIKPEAVEWIRSEFKDAYVAQRIAPPDGEGPQPLLLPWGGGGVTNPTGVFSMILVVPWSFNCVEGSIQGETRPPARHGVAALRIEIEGRDPVILDVPEGTWTEHAGTNDPWATWDMGVLEVP